MRFTQRQRQESGHSKLESQEWKTEYLAISSTTPFHDGENKLKLGHPDTFHTFGLELGKPASFSDVVTPEDPLCPSSSRTYG